MNNFVAQCTPGMQLVDVGAHWGIFTLAALRYGGSNTRAICIEASRAAAGILTTNLSLNNCSDRVRVVEAAAGPASGYLDMLTTGAGGADYFVLPSGARPDTIRVRQVSVSDVCRQYRFAPTHLKIDVEGYENEVLLGAEECINAYRPIIFLELHTELIRRRGRDPKLVLGTLKRLGYGRFVQNSRAVSATELEHSALNARLLCYPAN
jgi:FkbM family methyltransferase